MKKLILTTLSLGLLLIPYSCSNEEKVSLDENHPISELGPKIQVNETTLLVSDLFFKMGVSKIEVQSENGIISYTLRTERPFYMDGELVNFADYDIFYFNDALSLAENQEYKISFLNDEPYISSPNYNGKLSEINEENINKKVAIMSLFMREITMDFKEKHEYYSENNMNKSCSFFNTYYVFASGVSRSVSGDNLEGEIEKYGMEGCTTIGGEDSACLWGDYFCLTSQAFCCQ